MLDGPRRGFPRRGADRLDTRLSGGLELPLPSLEHLSRSLDFESFQIRRRFLLGECGQAFVLHEDARERVCSRKRSGLGENGVHVRGVTGSGDEKH